MSARKEIAFLKLDADNVEAAREEIDTIINLFGGNDNLPTELYNIGLRFGQRGQVEDALKLHKYNCQQFPQETAAMRSQSQVVQLKIKDGDAEDAEAEYESMLEVFSEQETLPEQITAIADVYIDANDFDKAVELEQSVIAQYPKTNYAMNAQQGIIKVYFAHDNLADANTAIVQLLADYNDIGNIAEDVFVFGEDYYDIGCAKLEADEQGEAENNLRKSLMVWENIASTLPESMLFTKHARYYSGVCYRLKLKIPSKALEHYKIVAEKWPDYENAWSAQTMIGACHRQMHERGEISQQEAENGIFTAYQAVMENYPDCPMAWAVCLQLGKMNYENGELEKAANYYQQYLEKYRNNDNWRSILVKLAEVYEELLQPAAAIELYNIYIGTSESDDSQIQMMQSRIEALEKGAEQQ